ncbi:MAG: sigma-70 family RNA polymerase sigma factor [Ruminococcus sp.]|nr:sigma-70 family RNA polymerase sigma factor [Ruminococcus sp.]MCR5141335.1 sigma-70 family RNA polymerase sigma factor [Ruminococcus sp.]
MFSENTSDYKLATDEIDDLAVLAKTDSAAAAELVSRLLPAIRSYSHRFDSSISEDLLQEGLLGALGAISDYRREKGRAATFIIACAKNKMLSAVKRFDFPDETAVLEDEPADTEQSFDYDPLYDAIESCLTQLEKRVVRCSLMGLSYRSTAERLGIDVKSVDNAMQRARKKLREEVADV